MSLGPECSSDPGSINDSGGRSSTSGARPECSDDTGSTESRIQTKRPRRDAIRTQETPLTRIFELIDFESLPGETQPIARMLTDGLTQTEIATSLGRSEDYVASRIRELRLALLDQALSRLDDLDVELREHVERLHMSIATAAGGRTGKRRTA